MEFKVSNKAKLTSAILLIVGLAALIMGIVRSHEPASERIWVNLLVNGYFYLTISVAALFFLALQYVAQMAWGVTTQRIFQAIMSFMPIGALVLLVVFIASSLHMNHIYHWMQDGITDPQSEHYDKIITSKSSYLNVGFFWVRLIIYLAVWLGIAFVFRKMSLKEDKLELNGGVSPIYKKLVPLSVIFILFFAYSSSTSAWDWLMSIDTHWFSTMFGWYCFSGMWVSMMIVAVVLVQYLKRNGYLKEVNSSHIHDLGKWMFAISCLWAYTWFAQFMLIWYSDIPEEAIYYTIRFKEYGGLYLGVFAVNFFLPFFVLMSRDAKRNGIFLVPVALIVFVGHWLDVLIMVLPGTMHEHGHVGALEIGMFLSFLGVFIFVVLTALSRAPLMVKNHPMYDESIHLHH